MAIGSDVEILRLKTFGTRLENLNRRTVLPGFNDAHIHIWKVGNLMTYMLDLRGVHSIAEMQERIADFANRHPESEWIQARGFNEALFPDGQMPNRYHLDEVVSDRPLSVIRTCAHQMIVNTKALERSGITEKTPIPHGGEIKLLPNGELGGHFTETALGLINNKIPSYSAGEYRNMILAAQEEMLRLGITSATDPAVMPDLLEVYRKWIMMES
jgi:predicted amidohydrolase YtcJ